MTSRRARLGILVGLPLAVYAAAPGCNSNAPPALVQSCSINSDCNSPLICAFTRCHTQCTDTRDCPPGERCVPDGANAVCQLSIEATCGTGGTCFGNETCGADMQCRAPCGPTGSCLASQTCGPNNQCNDPNNSIDKMVLAVSGLLDAGSAQDGGGTGDATASSDAGSTDASVPGPAAPAPGTCVLTGKLLTPRSFPLVATLNNGKVLVAGGGGPSGGAPLMSAELYDPSTGAFAATGSMSIGRAFYPNSMVGRGVGSGGSALLADGRILAVGGGLSDGTFASAAEIYDPASGTWSPTGGMVIARKSATLITLSTGRILVLGGYAQPGNATTSAEMYDPTSGTFSLVGSVIAGRAVAAASLLPNGNFLVVGGEFNGNSPFQTTVEMYTPGADGGAGTFSSVGMVPGVAGYGYAFPLPGGKVLVNGAFTNLGTVSLFDPSTSAFAQAPADLISGGNGLLLESGDVFFATGYPGGSGGAHTTQTELYQSATGTWKHTGNMSSAHHVPGMAELPNGNVLVVGGLDNSNSTLDVVEACSP